MSAATGVSQWFDVPAWVEASGAIAHQPTETDRVVLGLSVHGRAQLEQFHAREVA